jgi:hypothetical protein
MGNPTYVSTPEERMYLLFMKVLREKNDEFEWTSEFNQLSDLADALVTAVLKPSTEVKPVEGA